MENCKLWIDGIPVEAPQGKSILNAALDAGIYIPHLCSHPDLTPQGGCKLCLVEVDGEEARPVTACTTPVREGMRVRTSSDGLDRLRRMSMELMLAGHPHDCTGCRSFGNCEFQALIQYLSVAHSRMKDVHRATDTLSAADPLIDRELERCIRCGRCVRVCREVRGVGILDYRKKGEETYIGTEGGLSLADAGCRFCGACVEVCPTGALQDREGVFRKDLTKSQALVPCQAECPAHIDIPRYVRLVKEGRCAEAVAVIREKVPFPHALGRVCTHRCESGCRRQGLNGAVDIRDLKRFAVEHDDKALWRQRSANKPDTGKRVAVVGGGPAGLTAAYYLARQGHAVTVLERLPVAGGMLSTGIPAYRLPREEVRAEIDAILEAGVVLETGREVRNAAALRREGYDAVLAAVGAAAGRVIPLEGCVPACCATAVGFLRSVSLGRDTAPVTAGSTVAVLGGGNVAFDAARVARRLGAEVKVICLEAREAMLADEEEILQAQEEGVTVLPGRINLAVETRDGAITGVRTAQVASFRFEEGKLVAETIPGTEEVLAADTILFAAGQRPELTPEFGLELDRFGHPLCGEDHAASAEGVFAAGDVVTGTRTVIEAIQAGREAAAAIDRYLGGDGDISETLVDPAAPGPELGLQEGFAGRARCRGAVRPAGERMGCFAPVDLGLACDEAGGEAGRCLQCDLRGQLHSSKMWTAYVKR